MRTGTKGPNGTPNDRSRIFTRNAADACLSCAGTIVWFKVIAMILRVPRVTRISVFYYLGIGLSTALWAADNPGRREAFNAWRTNDFRRTRCHVCPHTSQYIDRQST